VRGRRLQYDERREVNKKVYRLWREEGLQVRVRSPWKRAGVSSLPTGGRRTERIVGE
jgi:hypothetical protein